MTQPCLACSAVADPGVLNRAEWIKFVATFYNKEDVANDLFATTSKVRASLVNIAYTACTDEHTSSACFNIGGMCLAHQF